MFILQHLWIILALPLAGSAINFIFGRNWPKRAVDSVGIGSVALTFLAGLEAAREFLLLDASRFHG